jgi:hypothetical protein
MSEIRNDVLQGTPYLVDSRFSSTIQELTSEVENLFECEDLSRIHEKINRSYSLRTAENDDQTIYHKIFYDKIHAGWYDFIFLYHRLISEIKSRYQINYEIVFQKTPSVRFHLPNNLAVGEFHTDSQYNHPEGELNVSVPLTDAILERGIFIKIGDGSDGPIYKDMSCKHGELTLFNGNKLLHGNKVNTTNETRVSFDFRLISKADYLKDREMKSSFGQNVKFELGGYYSRYFA